MGPSKVHESDRGLTLVQKIGVVAGAVAAVAGALGAVLALARGDDGPKPAPKATLLVQHFEPLVTLGEFARRFPDYAPRHLTPEKAALPGGLFRLNLTYRNFEKRHCVLTWTMYNDANDDPLPKADLVDHPAGEFKLDSAFEQFTPPVWIPAPTRVEDIYVFFELADDEGPCGSPFRSEKIAVE